MNNLNKLIHRLVKFINYNTLQPTLITIVFLFGSLFVPSNKLLFVWSGLYLIAQLYITKSFLLVIASVFIPLSIINVGQLYVFQAIPREELLGATIDYSQGRQLFFTLSPFFVWELTVICGIILIMISKGIRFFKTNIPTLFLLLIGLFTSISALESEFFPTLSLLYTIGLLGWIAWIWTLRSYLLSLSAKNRIKVLELIFQHILVTGLFISLIVFVQYIFRSPLGLTIEETKILPVFGIGADENPLQFRPVGLSSHANILANNLLILLLSGIFLRNYLNKAITKRVFFLFFLFVMVFSIILTLSRAVYLALLIYLSGFVYFFEDKKKIAKYIKKVQIIVNRFRIIIYPPLLVIFLIILDRFAYTFFSFTGTGGVTVRSQLMDLSYNIFSRYPILGVGQGMFIPAGYSLNSKGIMSTFPEAVHNGFLLIISEGGLLSLLTNFTFLISLFLLIIKSNLPSFNKKMSIIGVLSLLSVMFFHPFINIVVLYTLLIVLVI